MKFIVIGLGSFGSSLALRLAEYGHEVVGVDNNEAHVNLHMDQLTYVLKMDSTNEQAVNELPLANTDSVIIAIGEDMGASITTAALFKKHVPDCKIIARVSSEIQATIFEAMDIHETVNPQAEYAAQFANRLSITGNLRSLILDDGYEIAEFKVPGQYAGKMVKDLEIISEWKVSLVTIIRHSSRKNLFGKEIADAKVYGVIDGSTTLQEGDTMVLFGKRKALEKMAKELEG